jgi:hypothetical protein
VFAKDLGVLGLPGQQQPSSKNQIAQFAGFQLTSKASIAVAGVESNCDQLN